MFLDSTVSQMITFWIDRLGDPYISSWINTVLYIFTFIAAIFKWRNLKWSQATYGEQYLWLFFIFALFSLGVNKQFDFQTLIITTVRDIAKYGGWFEMRRLVQALFAYALVGVGIIFVFIMLMLLSTREFWRHNALAMIGFGILCLYVVIRETSISHVGFVADSASRGEFRFTDIIEFFGILCIFINALTRYKTKDKETPKTVKKRKRKFLWVLPIFIGIGMVAFFISPYKSYIDIRRLDASSFIGAHRFSIGNWSPGIGDSSYMGWFIVFSYYFTSFVCFLKLFFKRVRQQKQERIFWIFICFSMVVLGLIKQFNLLVAVDEVFRMMAHSDAWYTQRRNIQGWVMAIGGVIFLITVIRALRKPVIARHSITMLGFAYLLLFVIFRGISLHQFEAVLSYEILGTRVNWIAELLGIYWVCLSTLAKRIQ